MALSEAAEFDYQLFFNSREEDLKNGVLDIKGAFMGDKFPSTEAFIVDQSGKTKQQDWISCSHL